MFSLEGELKLAIEAKRRIAEAERTWEERGWFSCEITEGLLDDQCVAEQAALGNQGIPREYLIFDPLMPDPEPYAVDEEVARTFAATLSYSCPAFCSGPSA